MRACSALLPITMSVLDQPSLKQFKTILTEPRQVLDVTGACGSSCIVSASYQLTRVVCQDNHGSCKVTGSFADIKPAAATNERRHALVYMDIESRPQAT